jgi:hypothetical protein
MSDERTERNAIFAPKIPESSGIQSVAAVDQVRAEFGLEIPVEVVPLPSQGKVYPAGSAFHNAETVELRSMTAREEDILTSQALMKKGTIITELIKSCLVDKTINVADLLIGDRMALMVAIRITGYGADYEAEVTCSACEAKESHVFDLGQLPIKRLELDPVTPGSNVFEFVLPHCKKTVKFKFMTGRDEEDMNTTQQKQKKLGLQSDATVTTNLLYSILSVSGIEDRAKIAQFVKMLPARDSKALRDYIRKNEPGISMRQEVTCSSCNNSEEVVMPIGIKFLWPAAE